MLVKVLGNWKNAIDKVIMSVSCLLIIDLSNNFDAINYDLLLTKLKHTVSQRMH